MWQAVKTVNENQVASITMNTKQLKVKTPLEPLLLLLLGNGIVYAFESGWAPGGGENISAYAIATCSFVFSVMHFWDKILRDLAQTPKRTISHFVKISSGNLYCISGRITGAINARQAENVGILEMSIVCENEDVAMSTAVKEIKKMYDGATFLIKGIELISNNVVLANSTEQFWDVTAMSGKACILVGATDINTAKDVGLAAIYKDLPFSGVIHSAQWKAPIGRVRVIALPPQLPGEILKLIQNQKG
jgi:hypothetical protein